MFKSIVDDIKFSFRSGNMITRVIIITSAVSLLFIILKAFLRGDPGMQLSFIQFFALPGNPFSLLIKPWTLFTHLLIHADIWHLLWNMLFLYWFGRIVGDMIGDQRILPLYLLGGLVGAFAYLISYQLLGYIGSYALGASAAVMAIVVCAGAIAPDYVMRLILIGDVKLKYIVFFVVLIDIIGVTGSSNTGGHIAHLGGALFGFFYVRQLREGTDLALPVNNLLNKIGNFFQGGGSRPKKGKSTLNVKYRSERKTERKRPTSKDEVSFQAKLDNILDKIKESGYESLTEEEKEFLFQASKK
ncbi:MAG: rhomboid family intramembrane serine protease [Saprospiraceae bacterium]|nr:rhomboid family intramembrane serine protease [Saprospiraceae bacterium]